VTVKKKELRTKERRKNGNCMKSGKTPSVKQLHLFTNVMEHKNITWNILVSNNV
jgi:hypothetical protein